MKIVFPIETFGGADSPLYAHFGSAPSFALVDTDTRSIESLTNANEEHEHGACNPLQALANISVDAVVVGGIGAGALNGLRSAGIRVFRSELPTIGDVLNNLDQGALLEILPGDVCAHHGGCGCGGH
jgi:predicted Fe-Mo cluster-binding NifX family protein